MSKLKPVKKKSLSEELEIFVQFLLSNRDTVGTLGESGENAVWTTKYTGTSIIKSCCYYYYTTRRQMFPTFFFFCRVLLYECDQGFFARAIICSVLVISDDYSW